jgi:hypothetical protein
MINWFINYVKSPIKITLFDPQADLADFVREWEHLTGSSYPYDKINFAGENDVRGFDIKIFAVKHDKYVNLNPSEIETGMNEGGLVADLVNLNKSVKMTVFNYWGL